MNELDVKQDQKKRCGEKLKAIGSAGGVRLKGAAQRFRAMSRKKQIGSLVALVLAAAVGGYFTVGGLFTGNSQATEYTEYEVSRGDIQVTISGSGSITPRDQYEVKATVQGDVLSDTFEEGDTVEKGQLLYTIDSTDVENTIERANISLEKSTISYQDSQKAVTGLSVTASTAGKVAELYVKKGDKVQAGAQIARVVDDSLLTAKVPFSETDVSALYVGQTVTVTVENTFEQLSGTITAISNGSRILEGYMKATDVTVSVNNPGALQAGTYISVTAGSVSSQSGGELEYSSEKIVESQAAGTVERIISDESVYVSRGTVIVKLANDDASDSLRDSSLSLREAQLSYENTAKQLEDYRITAPISGSIIDKSVKAGDTIDNTSAQTVMAIIADMSELTVTIYVDELDIAGLEKGQEVAVTADALPERQYTGYVDNISINGTSSNGVTTYPVKIVVNEPEDLWPGMNVTADIVTDSAEDVLRIPTAAVQRGDTVLLKDNTQQKVELGLSDEDYIEVSGGVSEGDIILVPQAAAASSNSGQMPEGGMPGGSGGVPGGGGMPGGSGGAPGGGMPSGGGGRAGGGPGGM